MTTNFNFLISKYFSSARDLYEFFNIKFDREDILKFVDKTDYFFIEVEMMGSGLKEICWSEKKETLKEDCDDFTVVDKKCFYSKDKKFVCYMTTDSYFIVFKSSNKVAF